MKAWVAFWGILAKDMRTYYLKPPNISWGILFPLAWTLMFLIRSGQGFEQARGILPGVMALAILFGTTSMVAVTVTFEKRGRSFERLLLAPIPLEVLMLAKTSGAILMGVFNAAVPVAMAAFLVDLGGVRWCEAAAGVVLTAASSAFLGLLVAVSVSEVFEAQTLSNFFRFPMVFLCGLFFPVAALPAPLRVVAHVLPLTYGADLLHGAVNRGNRLHPAADLVVLGLFCAGLFAASLRTIRRRWIL